MRRIILALLLAFPFLGYGQTAKYILDGNDDVKIGFFNSTNVSVISNAVFSNSSAFRNSLGLGQSNFVNFRAVTVSSSEWNGITIDPELGIEFSIDSVSAAARTRTNLSLGLNVLTNNTTLGFRYGVGLGESNAVTFGRLDIGSHYSYNPLTGSVGVTGQATVQIKPAGIYFYDQGATGPEVVLPSSANQTRTNLGIPWSGLTNTNASTFQVALFNSSSLNAQGQRITNLAAPVNNSDAATREYVFGLFSRVAPTVSFTNSVNTVEIGSQIISVSLGWSISPTNTPVASQTLTASQGTTSGASATNTRSATAFIPGPIGFPNAPFTNDTTWTLTVNDGTGLPGATVTNSTSIAFRHYLSWGIASTTSLSNSQIQNLHTNTPAGAGREFRTGKGKSVSISGNGQYIYFAYPASFGAASFIVNNAPNTAWISNTVTYTNSSGNSSQFLIYRSTDVQFGTSIPITIN